MPLFEICEQRGDEPETLLHQTNNPDVAGFLADDAANVLRGDGYGAPVVYGNQYRMKKRDGTVATVTIREIKVETVEVDEAVTA